MNGLFLLFISFHLCVLRAQCNNYICIPLQFTNMLRTIHLHWVKEIQVFCSMRVCWAGVPGVVMGGYMCVYVAEFWLYSAAGSPLLLASLVLGMFFCLFSSWNLPSWLQMNLQRVGFPKPRRRGPALFPAQAFIHRCLEATEETC